MNIKKDNTILTTQAYINWIRDSGDETYRLNYDITSEDIVFDAGGFKGDFADRIYDLYKCNIHIFEPVKTFYDNIKNRFNTNSKITIYQYGLGKDSRQLKIHLGGDSTKLLDHGDGELAEVRDIQLVLNNLQNPTVKLFKINIEGGEYDLLDRLIETGLIKNIVNLQVQFHNFYPNALERYNTIVTNLNKTHNQTYCYPFIWEGWKIK